MKLSMKKSIIHILISMIIILFVSFSCIANVVNADTGINCASSVNLNSSFTVSLTLPSNAYAAEATVTVKFSDGSTSSGKIVYVQGMSDYPNSVSFTAKVAGTATVSVTNIVVSDSNSNALENGGSKSQTITVVNPNATTNTTSTTPTTTTNTSTTTNTATTTTTTVKFTDANETVYTTERCNIRESYSTTSTKVATVNKDTELKRTGVGDNGWSKVEYNGKTCYVYTSYLTTTKPADPEFTTVNETMYATQNCNLRSSWSTSSDKVGYLEKGQEVTRIGVSSNGWSKIKYNGKEVYVATRLLQSDPVDDEEDENNVTNETNETNVVNNNTTVDANVSNEIAEIKEEIGVLPEVGRNVAVYVFSGLAIILASVACYGIYYTNKEI